MPSFNAVHQVHTDILSSSELVHDGIGHNVQVLNVNNERFMVPEALFRSLDIGLQQAGLAETVRDAVEAVHPDLRPLLYSNVLCTGGSAKCPGFRQRLYDELRPLVSDDYEVCTVLMVMSIFTWHFVGGFLHMQGIM